MRYLGLITVPLILFSFSIPALSAESVLSAPPRPQYSEGDRAFEKRNDPEQARKALDLFRKYHSENPTDAEAGWRHAMACYFAGLHLVKSDNEKAKLFAEGRDAGQAALKLSPDCVPCHFWTAINMALYGQAVGPFKMFFSLGSIRDHLQTSIQKDPSYAGAGAYRLLGLIEHKLPGILGGSNQRAREYLEKAIETAPNEPMNHLFLTKLLTEKFNDLPAALAVARKGIAVPTPSPERIESVGSLKELQEFLKRHEVPGVPGSS